LSESLGNAVLELRTDKGDFDHGIDEAKDKTESLTGAMFTAEAAFEVAKEAVKFLGEQLMDCVNQFMEAEQAETKLNAVLRATGGTVGLTSGRLIELAGRMQDTTMFEKEAVLQAEALLLTFNKISGETFPETIRMAADLASLMGTGLPEAARTLGRALQEPDNAAGLLRRAGIQLTDQQQTMIKRFMAINDVAGAQKIILDEVKGRVGGLADEMGRTAAGKMAIFQHRVNEIKEDVGKGIVDAAGKAVEGVGAINTSIALGTTGFGLYSTELKKAKAALQELKDLANQYTVNFGTAAKATGDYAADAMKAAGFTFDLGKALPKTTEELEKERKEFEKTQAAVDKYNKSFDNTFKNNSMASIAGMGLNALTENWHNAEKEAKKSLGAIKDTAVQAADAQVMAALNAKNSQNLIFQAAKQEIIDWGSVATSVVQSFGSNISPVFESIGAALVQQGVSWTNVGKAAIYAMAGIIKALGDQLAGMAAAKLIEAIANSFDPFTMWAAPGEYAAAGWLAAGAAAAWIASGALRAWGDSFAEGGIAHPGMALVGERGPELISVGQTSRIYPADETARMMGGGGFNFNLYGNVNHDVDLEKGMQRAYRRYRAIQGRQ
jgi:hypothetical protein